MDVSGRSAKAQVATQDAASVRLGAHVGALRFGCSLTLACCLHRGAAHRCFALEGAVPGHAGTRSRTHPGTSTVSDQTTPCSSPKAYRYSMNSDASLTVKRRDWMPNCTNPEPSSDG